MFYVYVYITVCPVQLYKPKALNKAYIPFCDNTNTANKPL